VDADEVTAALRDIEIVREKWDAASLDVDAPEIIRLASEVVWKLLDQDPDDVRWTQHRLRRCRYSSCRCPLREEVRLHVLSFIVQFLHQDPLKPAIPNNDQDSLLHRSPTRLEEI
jgi:hypothetical protein